MSENIVSLKQKLKQRQDPGAILSEKDWSIKIQRGSLPTESRIWEAGTLLTIGHPIRWILQRDSRGIIIRYISSETGRTHSNHHKILSFSEIKTNAPITLPNGSGNKIPVTILIRPKRHLEPIYETESVGSQKTKNLHGFRCVNGVIQSADFYYGEGTISFSGTKLFSFKFGTDGFNCTAIDPKIAVNGKSWGGAKTLIAADFFKSTFSLGQNTWHFSPALSGNMSAVPTLLSPKELPWKDREDVTFKRIKKFVAVASAVIIIAILFWPKPEITEEEKLELLPPQYAKLILQKIKKPAGAKSASTAAPNKAQAKAKRAAVVKAFRNTAVKKSMSNLLKGGMTRLLKNTNLIKQGPSNVTTKSLFKATANSKIGNSNFDRLTKSDISGVATLGGAGGKAGSLGAVGYGSGQQATVSGQGDGSVNLDGEGAAVAQGLTRDEVGRVIHQHINEVRYCYESAMIRNPTVQGKLVVDFNINPRGQVSWSRTNSSSLNDPNLDNCIIRRLNTWGFPKPKGGVNVAVTYPFILKTLGR